ncbi:MAG TPA: DUF6527 family protein [Thermomicrobiales bacterium]|nr:DUF6527 family protein [Thermomicrobiales bacterium]
MSLRSWFAAVWKRFFPPRRQSAFTRVIIAESGRRSQPAVAPGEALLIRSGARDKWLRFACPDRCGAMIMLDLSPTRRPHWSIELSDEGKLSVFPSVVNRECGAHFVVREGRIVWLQ